MTPALTSLAGSSMAARPRFLSEADCRDLLHRLVRVATGGGYTSVALMSTWRGHVRWGRNQVSTAGEVRDNMVTVRRMRNGAYGELTVNDTTDATLLAAVQRAERLLALDHERPNSDLLAREPLEPASTPALFSEATYQLDAERRAQAAVALMQQARDAGLLSAGYIEVVAASTALLDTLGRVRYFPFTQAQYSVTVRDPKAHGSGWAGLDHYDWTKLDTVALTQRALEKCVRSRNPVAIEPGRYTVILEPQAVADFVGPLVRGALGRSHNEYPNQPLGPFFKSRGDPAARIPSYSRLGEKVMDERVTISADPMDPDLGVVPFQLMYGWWGDPFMRDVFHPVTWIDRGVLVNLAYNRDQGIGMGHTTGLPNSGAFRMSGGSTSIEEMIDTTTRGLLVTRFDRVGELDPTSQLYRGYTRDGLWLIEHGKISKAVKNMAFTESVLFALNNLEQLGPPRRVFHPPGMWMTQGELPAPAIVPPLKIRDFSFTALTDAV